MPSIWAASRNAPPVCWTSVHPFVAGLNRKVRLIAVARADDVLAISHDVVRETDPGLELVEVDGVVALVVVVLAAIPPNARVDREARKHPPLVLDVAGIGVAGALDFRFPLGHDLKREGRGAGESGVEEQPVAVRVEPAELDLRAAGEPGRAE